MVTTSHPTLEELNDWRRGRMDGEEVITISRHVVACEVCLAAASQRMNLDEVSDALYEDIANEMAHPDEERDLFVYADGEATPTQRAAIEEHLALCVFCRVSVADARALAAPPHSVRPWTFALAATIAVAVVSSMWRTMPATAPLPVERGNPSLGSPLPMPSADPDDPRLAEVRSGASIRMPDILRELRSKPDILRGNAGPDKALSPVGVVLKTARPLFTWPDTEGSRAVVQVFAGEKEVMKSGILRSSQWRPEQMLPRGLTYTWTVRVQRDGITEILPSSPAPTAQFHVIDQGAFSALEDAERDHPDDHLLLGVLHAQAGLESEGRMHLRRVNDPRDGAIALRVLHELDSWVVP